MKQPQANRIPLGEAPHLPCIGRDEPLARPDARRELEDKGELHPEKRLFCRRQGASAGAFTILETTAVVVILLVLAALAVPSYQGFVKRAELPRCINNLRTLHTALNGHIMDKKQWPQVPEEFEIDSDEESYFWMRELEPFGMEAKSWICPTIARLERTTHQNAEIPLIHYKPTLFDEHEFTPRRWPQMPWAMEVGNVHGNGNLVLFGSGEVRGSNEVQ